MSKSKAQVNPQIARNRRAFYDYAISKQIEAGLKLEGWEVKSLRAGKAELVDSYVIFKDGEAYLFGSRIEPLLTANSHALHDPIRTRKLLLHSKEIETLREATEQAGYTCLALDLHWHMHMVKCSIGLAKGKKLQDKRETTKARELDREAQSAKKMDYRK